MTEKEFVKSWIKQISESLIREFPAGFIGSTKTGKIKMPGRSLVLGTELFGTYEITDSDGNVRHHVDSLAKAKYILYSNRNKPSELNIPLDDKEIEKAVRAYEKHLDSILMSIEKDFKELHPESKAFNRLSNQIFKALNLVRY